MSKSNVEKLYHWKSLPSADALLAQEAGEFSEVMLMGYNQNGELRYCSTRGLNVAEMFFLMDNVKHDILTGNVWERLKEGA